MPDLKLQNIRKAYGSVCALDGISLTIPDAEFCVIIGPSGSGKTTLLSIIAGFIKPESGCVILDGQDIEKLSPKDRNIGMVFQEIGLFSHLSVKKNISFGLDIRKKSKKEIDKRVGEIARRLRIERLLDNKPGQISGGEAQRVALARTIVSNPSIFLFDEPLGNLDADLRAEMILEIKKLHQSLRRTFVFVTHDQEQALSVADRIIIMKDGKVIQEGPPREIYQKPANRFVAEFFGILPMNLIEGKLISGSKGSIFQGAGLRHNFRNHVGKQEAEVILGIRPTDIVLGDRTEAEGIGLVTSIEPLGDRNQIWLALAQQEKIVVMTSTKFKPDLDTWVGVRFKEDKAILFDREDEKRLYP